MNIQAKKLELVDLILKTEKPALLEMVSEILKQEKEEDWWDELPDSVKESIKIGLNQAKMGETIPHENVLNEIKAKYGLKIMKISWSPKAKTEYEKILVYHHSEWGE